METLIDAHRWYRDKVNMLICSFDEDFHDYLPEIMRRQDQEIRELIVCFAGIYVSKQLKDYLVDLLNTMDNQLVRIGSSAVQQRRCCYTCIHGKCTMPSGDRICKFKGVVSADYVCRRQRNYPSSFNQYDNYLRLTYQATEIISDFYYEELDHIQYFSGDMTVKNIAVRSLGKYNSVNQFNRLIGHLQDRGVAESAIKGIIIALERNPGLIKELVEAYFDESNNEIRSSLSECLSYKVEYLIMKTTSDMREKCLIILKDILRQGKISSFIWFINNNADPKIEDDLVKIIKEVCLELPDIELSFGKQLNERLLEKTNIAPFEEKTNLRKEKNDPEFRLRIFMLITAVVLFFPTIFVVRHWDTIMIYDWHQKLRTYIVDFNYYLVFYSLAINFVYVVLLLISIFAARRQRRLWRLKTPTLLFKKMMLPSVSILAPAYNEEKTIIESVNSLLNVKYPDYELIVVNDASKDSTLRVLIDYFDLERAEVDYPKRLKTMPIHGVYINPSIPKLIVIDKENGGKADALNAGINFSSREYFCGIDADSLLEDDALLKLASLTLDAGVETPAMGGNILPINGCKVEHGQIVQYEIPKKHIARLQTVEYVRSFMTGRLGWASVNSLLIISGAFGLFRKERIIAIGGYLTSNEQYGKDTVGEDMEMVVRTRKMMHDKHLDYRIGFAFDANCWTQVPEDSKSLKRQRQRWSRGLADTLSFHRKLIFNPSYGRLGILAMPYFFIFELIGPLIELQGYLMVILAVLFGYINAEMALTLFVTTICLGVFVSMSSFIILEHSSMRFKGRDILTLLIYALIENFGVRQITTIWRATAIFRLITHQEGWGELKRQKFDKH